MALVVGDRVQETTTTTGTGTVSLLGAVTQFQSFAAGIGNGNSTYYTIADQSGVNWEEGIGTYTTSGSTLTRSVLASSNANALVNFPAGTKNVFCSYPAEAAVLAAPYAYPTIRPTLNLDFVNSNQVDPRITFVRSTTATYYDGKTTALAEQNLLTYSQDFSNAVWFNSNISLTTNSIISPDGTQTASTISAQAVSSVYYRQAITPTPGANYTVTRYVKSGTKTFCAIGFNTLPDAFFDLTNLTYNFTGANTISASIVDVGNGWRKISATWLATAGSTQVYLAMASSLSSNSSLTVGDTLYYWGAQLEQRSTSTAYTPTTTTAITNYITQLMTAPTGVPRLDYNPITGQALGLLIEEARTNLLTYSQAFISHTVVLSATSGTFVNGESVTATGGGTGKYLSDKSTSTLAAIYNGTGTFTGTLTGSTSGATGTCGTVTLIWTPTNSTVSPNIAIAPDGTQTAQLVVANSTSGAHFIYASLSPSTGTAYTVSAYFKSGGYNFASLQITFGGLNAYCSYNLSTGALTGVSGGGGVGAITPAGNGWYKCSLTATTISTAANYVALRVENDGTLGNWSGNGYSGIFIWGAQLEAGSFATSYIPTVASQVTRNADQASMTGTNFSSWYNQSQGTFYAEADANLSTSNARGIFAVQDAAISSTNSISEYYDGNNVSTTYVLVKAGSSLLSINTLTKNNKSALAYGTNPIIASGGTTGISTPTASAMPTVDRMYIGWLAWYPGYLNAHIRSIRYYSVALPSATLQALTS